MMQVCKPDCEISWKMPSMDGANIQTSSLLNARNAALRENWILALVAVVMCKRVQKKARAHLCPC